MKEREREVERKKNFPHTQKILTFDYLKFSLPLFFFPLFHLFSSFDRARERRGEQNETAAREREERGDEEELGEERQRENAKDNCHPKKRSDETHTKSDFLNKKRDGGRGRVRFSENFLNCLGTRAGVLFIKETEDHVFLLFPFPPFFL